jgi:NTE family protein
MPKIGLVLAGGGARGAYQIGAWKALRELGIDHLISCYSGASVGSLNAALFAMDDYQLAYDVWMSLDKKSLFNVDQNIFKRLKDEKLSFLNRGVYDTKRLEELINDTIDCDVLRTKDVFVTTTFLGNEKSTFFDLLRTNYLHYFKSENQTKYQNLREITDDAIIKNTMLASCAIPVAFRPVQVGAETFYDGGIFDNTPYLPLIDMGCDVIIIIDLFKISFSRKKEVDGVKLITVHPKKSLRGVLDFDQKYIKRRFELGYQDTMEVLQHQLHLLK